MYYFLIYQHETEATCLVRTHAELTADLSKGYYDDVKWLTLEDVKGNSDPGYWGERAILLVKGDITAPIPKQIVQSWEVS